MNNPFLDGSSKAGIAGGMLCTMMVTVSSTDLTKTITLAAIGAITSFGVSILCKWIVRRWKK